MRRVDDRSRPSGRGRRRDTSQSERSHRPDRERRARTGRPRCRSAGPRRRRRLGRAARVATLSQALELRDQAGLHADRRLLPSFRDLPQRASTPPGPGRQQPDAERGSRQLRGSSDSAGFEVVARIGEVDAVDAGRVRVLDPCDEPRRVDENGAGRHPDAREWSRAGASVPRLVSRPSIRRPLRAASSRRTAALGQGENASGRAHRSRDGLDRASGGGRILVPSSRTT